MIEKVLKKDEIISHLNVREYLNSANTRKKSNIHIIICHIFIITQNHQFII